jgi:hypothetical protein
LKIIQKLEIGVTHPMHTGSVALQTAPRPS